MSEIHPTAIVGDQVALGERVRVGPNAILEGAVQVGAGTTIGPNAQILGPVTVGEDCQIGLGALIGGDPQILNWKRVDSPVAIGNRTIIREYVTIHRPKDVDGKTVIGDDCLLMGLSHVAHDCRLGNHVVVCNGSLLAGHVEVANHAFISGNCPIHQFVRIGRLAMVQGLTAVGKDVAPFTLVDQTNTARALNSVGLRRAGFSADQRRALSRAFKEIFLSDHSLANSIAEVASWDPIPEVREIIDFIQASKRGVCLGNRRAAAEMSEA